jgi:hypothetical protein
MKGEGGRGRTSYQAQYNLCPNQRSNLTLKYRISNLEVGEGSIHSLFVSPSSYSTKYEEKEEDDGDIR